jgi:hypothetical protein
VAAAGQDLDGVVGDLQLDPVAVELDLMDPTLPDGTLAIGEGRAGSMNPKKCAFTPIAAGFRRWNAITNSQRH